MGPVWENSHAAPVQPRQRPADWAVTSGIAEAISPTMGAYGLGAGLGTTYQATKAGDYGNALEAGLPLAMAMVPGLKGKPAAAVAEQPKGIRAYHGSPHDFDRFDISKIGTGEGAQAYGHGLYFAENEGVARSYRDALKKDKHANSATDRFQNLHIDGQPLGKQYDIDPSYVSELKGLIDGGDQNAIKSFLSEKLQRWQAYSGDETYPFRPYAVEKTKAYQGLLDRLDAGGKIDDLGRGRMYEVNIKADPEHFLDWDKPLSQQSEAVRNALRAQADKHQADASLGPRRAGKHVDQYRFETDAPASQTILSMGETMGGQDKIANILREQGIPGIRYLDQGSRGAGEGSRNYVVFDPATIEILRKYGLLGPMAGGVGVNALMQDHNQ
jgi:hypothetical protein